MSIELGLAILAVIAALASALYAWKSSELSKRLNALAEDEHRKKHASISLYLIDGVCWDVSGGRIYAFAITVTNKATSPVSIPKVELHISACDDLGFVSQIILQPAEAVNVPNDKMKFVDAPINIDARVTLSGWFSYFVPSQIYSERSVDQYKIVFTSEGGERSDVTQYIIQRIANE